MNWNKLGKIYSVNNDNPCLLTHASNPMPIHLKDDIYRIYYSGRNKNNQSSISYVDIDILSGKIIYDHKNTILEYGDENSFYSHGISIGNMWEQDGNKYVGFMGWQVPSNGHWRGDIGKFDLDTKQVTIMLGVSEEDKVSLSYPFVLKEDGIYKMWYGSTIDWVSPNGEMIHVIKYATSNDGKVWNHKGLSIPYELGKAQAFSRPSVVKLNNKYHMWFSYRSGDGTPYRIGYAHSIDGENWEIQNSGITTSDIGWDSEMICYPFVFEHKNNLYMLYNGNSYGKEGFGIAVSKDVSYI